MSELPKHLEHPESDRERAKLYADLALDIAHRSEIARAPGTKAWSVGDMR